MAGVIKWVKSLAAPIHRERRGGEGRGDFRGVRSGGEDKPNDTRLQTNTKLSLTFSNSSSERSGELG